MESFTKVAEEISVHPVQDSDIKPEISDRDKAIMHMFRIQAHGVDRWKAQDITKLYIEKLDAIYEKEKEIIREYEEYQQKMRESMISLGEEVDITFNSYKDINDVGKVLQNLIALGEKGEDISEGLKHIAKRIENSNKAGYQITKTNG